MLIIVNGTWNRQYDTNQRAWEVLPTTLKLGLPSRTMSTYHSQTARGATRDGMRCIGRHVRGGHVGARDTRHLEPPIPGRLTSAPVLLVVYASSTPATWRPRTPSPSPWWRASPPAWMLGGLSIRHGSATSRSCLRRRPWGPILWVMFGETGP